MLKKIYFWLFAILYIIVAVNSGYHAFEFFGLANGSIMAIMLAAAFEIGQAAVLFSLLTSAKERNKVMPWTLMGILTLVQVIGNVYSSYKYIMLNSLDNLQWFKDPIFVWMDLPDAQATVIVTYIIGAILPIVALLLTAMVTNQLETDKDNKVVKDILEEENKLEEETPAEFIEDKKEEYKEIAKAVFEEPKKEVVEEQKDESSNETEVIEEPTDVVEEIENIEGDAELPIEEEIIENTDEDKLDYSDPIVKEVENALGDAEVPVEEDVLEDNGDVNMIMNGEAIPRSAFASETPTKKSKFVNI